MASGSPATPKGQKRQFEKGDRVFAKVRGYPPWPARVENIAQKSNTPKNVRYDIFYYGTYQTGRCTGDQLWSFEENRDKYGTPKNSKGFKEAMDEIVNNPKVAAPSAEATSLSEPEEETEATPEPTTTPSTPKTTQKRPASSTPKTAQKRPASSTPKAAASAKKKAKKSDVSENNEKTTTTAPTTTSKTGLTVVYPFKFPKEKKVAAPKDDECSDIPEKSDEPLPESSPEKVDESTSLIPAEAKSPAQEENSTDTTVKPKQEEGAVEVKLTKSQILQLLGHQNLPDSLRAKLENHVNTSGLIKKFLLRELWLVNTAAKLLDSCSEKSLPELETTLKILNELANYPIDALLLKKRPVIVESLIKLEEYYNTNASDLYSELSDGEKEKIGEDAKIIREKCTEILFSFKRKCQVPEGESFPDWLQRQSDILKKTVPDKQQFLFLLKDPTSKSSCNDSNADVEEMDTSEVDGKAKVPDVSNKNEVDANEIVSPEQDIKDTENSNEPKHESKDTSDSVNSKEEISVDLNLDEDEKNTEADLNKTLLNEEDKNNELHPNEVSENIEQQGEKRCDEVVESKNGNSIEMDCQ